MFISYNATNLNNLFFPNKTTMKTITMIAIIVMSAFIGSFAAITSISSQTGQGISSNNPNKQDNGGASSVQTPQKNNHVNSENFVNIGVQDIPDLNANHQHQDQDPLNHHPINPPLH